MLSSRGSANIRSFPRLPKSGQTFAPAKRETSGARFAPRNGSVKWAPNKKALTRSAFLFGADYGARTRHLHLGKVALYQMS